MSHPDKSPTPPTNVRWVILALLMAYAGLCHFNRISISVAGTERIMKEYSLDETQMGMVYSSYLFVYTIFMTPGGWLIDRIGPKNALLIVGLGSAILVPLTGAASLATPAMILVTLCVIRGALGLVSAPIHPGAARAVSLWLPVETRATGNGLVTGAAVTGIALTYFVFGFLMDVVTWPYAFAVAGTVTSLLTLTWWAFATNRPAEHLGVNDAERKLILADELARPSPPKDVAGKDKAGDSGLMALLLNRSLVMLTLSYAALSYFQYLAFYWVEYYFKDILELPTSTSRLYATITMAAMAVGMFGGGWLSDQIETRVRHPRRRSITPMVGMVASGLLLLAAISTSQSILVVACFALSMGALGMSEAPFWVTGVQLGRRQGGLSGAILNTVGNAGGILGPVVTPLFSKQFGWQAGLGLASVICIVGAAFWLWVDPEEGVAGAGNSGGKLQPE